MTRIGTITMTEFLVVNLRTLVSETENYATAKNVIRYGLRKDKYDAGQYDIHNKSTGEITRAYKKA
jgi:Arc/MetJ-type ribon-helix-helix transcriptional regulator